MIQNLRMAKDCIAKARRIAIASHINPDGDSIGSLLSLGLALEKLGKRVYMISEDGVPKRYRTLPGADRIIRKVKHEADLAIAVDCSSKEILGNTYDYFKKVGDIIEIDHHEFRRPFGNIMLVDHDAASVGELIYVLLKDLGVAMTDNIAQNLMTSIIVETNSFRLPNVRPFTFEVCKRLIDFGVNFYKLVDTVFWSKSRESAILTGICLSRCKFLKKGTIAWSVIKRADFDRAGGDDEDVDPVPDEMRSIKDVRVALLFREKDRRSIRVSLRSKGKINVATIAEHYGGGGHFDVAGCNIDNSREAIRDVLSRSARLLK